VSRANFEAAELKCVANSMVKKISTAVLNHAEFAAYFTEGAVAAMGAEIMLRAQPAMLVFLRKHAWVEP
jgi:hypothetical protein